MGRQRSSLGIGSRFVSLRSPRISERAEAIMAKEPSKLQKPKANLMWGGRFSASPDALMEAINESISVDQRMAAEDIQGSLVHSDMLATRGIITADDRDAIHKGLTAVRAEIDGGKFAFSKALEDIHMNV